MNKLIVSVLLCATLTGCKFFGADPAPPTHFEETIFNVHTNWIDQIVFRTNKVEMEIPKLVLTTNVDNQIVIVTNKTTLTINEFVPVTNQVPTYTLTPKENTQAIANVGGTLANLAIPGLGGIATIAIGAFFRSWGKMRSYKGAGQVLTQNIATVREAMRVLPQGQKLDDAFSKYLEDHQQSAGVIDTVATLIENGVNDQAAKGAAQEIHNFMASLK